MTRPTADPTFATAAPAASRQEPSGGLRASGYVEGDPLAARNLNYYVGVQGDYLEWWRTARFYGLNLAADVATRWLLQQAQSQSFTIGAGGKRGIEATVSSGLNSVAAVPLEIMRVDGQAISSLPDGAAFKLRSVACNVRVDGTTSGSDAPRIRWTLTRTPQEADEPEEVVWESPDYSTKTAAFVSLAFIVPDEGIVLDPRSTYRLSAIMYRDSIDDRVEFSSARAIIERPIAE